jgi:ribosomal protein S8
MKSSNQEPSIIINLKYYQNRPAIRGITQISKPGKRAYFSKQRLLKISELNN